MIKPSTIATVLIFNIAPLSTPALAGTDKCNEDKPCIVEATSATIRYYNSDLKETESIKKKAFNKKLPDDGLATNGRKVIGGVSMIELTEPTSLGGIFVEETAFELDPEKTIDCTGIALATVGHDSDSTTGVSVGLGHACSKNK